MVAYFDFKHMVLIIFPLLFFLMINVKTKKCYECNRELPIDNFTKNKNNIDGLSYYCRECTKKHYNVHKYKESGKEEYEQIIIEELKKYDIPIKGLDREKINNLRINMIDFPGILTSLLKDLPTFLKKYSLTYEEYKAIVQACRNNNFWIESKDLNTTASKDN